MPRTPSPTLATTHVPEMGERSASATTSPLDTKELLARCMGSAALAQRLVASFTSRTAEEIDQLDRLLKANQIDDFTRKAHQLRGSAANVSAHELKRLFGVVERLGNEDRATEIKQYMIELRREADRLNSYCGELEWEAAAQAPINQ
jgi:HPt (histidine-containing phosphotransfer) domain-containing protein